MTDLISRLRGHALPSGGEYIGMCEEAADHIAALEAEVEDHKKRRSAYEALTCQEIDSIGQSRARIAGAAIEALDQRDAALAEAGVMQAERDALRTRCAELEGLCHGVLAAYPREIPLAIEAIDRYFAKETQEGIARE